jgi:hypothetical protein
MTPEQYWDGDPTLVKYYRKAAEIKKESRNEELWLQGMYIYEALCNVSPVLHAYAKKGTKPHPYSEKPYAITAMQRKLDEEERTRKIVEKGKRFMNAVMQSTNKRFGGKTQSE